MVERSEAISLKLSCRHPCCCRLLAARQTDRELGELADPAVDGDPAAVLLGSPDEWLMASSISASAASQASASSRSARYSSSLCCSSALARCKIGYRVVERLGHAPAPVSSRTSSETRMCGMDPLAEAAPRSRSNKLPSTIIPLPFDLLAIAQERECRLRSRRDGCTAFGPPWPDLFRPPRLRRELRRTEESVGGRVEPGSSRPRALTHKIAIFLLHYASRSRFSQGPAAIAREMHVLVDSLQKQEVQEAQSCRTSLRMRWFSVSPI